MKVRIGNDIRLSVNLLSRNGFDAINIHSMKAYLINTSKYDRICRKIEEDRKWEEEHKHTPKFISRFPIEPHDHHRPHHHSHPDYCATDYDICCSGRPVYHVHPTWYVPVYHGFGVYPHSFEPHLWHTRDEHHGLYPFTDCKPHGVEPHLDHLRFEAPVESTEDRDRVRVYFPGECQMYTGTYKLVIVAKLYVPGYSSHKNLKTVTMDYPEVFTLVDQSSEADVNDNVDIVVGNNTTAASVMITGVMGVNVGGSGELNAVVYPADIDDNRVIWSIVDGTSITPVISEGTRFRYVGVKQGTTRVRATSVKNPSVYAEVTITVSDAINIDIYTNRGTMDNHDQHNIKLDLTDGSSVYIDTSKETQWYEGN